MHGQNDGKEVLPVPRNRTSEVLFEEVLRVIQEGRIYDKQLPAAELPVKIRCLKIIGVEENPLETSCCIRERYKKPPESFGFRGVSWKRDLNPRPTDYESVALPTALFQHCVSGFPLTLETL